MVILSAKHLNVNISNSWYYKRYKVRYIDMKVRIGDKGYAAQGRVCELSEFDHGTGKS